MEIDPDDVGRLEKLETHAVQTSSRLDHIERTQVHHGNKLDQIVTAVTRAEGKPVFEIAKTVSMVRDLFAIGAILASLSIWLVLTLTAANDRVTELQIKYQADRLSWIESRFNWRAAIEATK